jgi:bacterioferritin (cytochrome b1)
MSASAIRSPISNPDRPAFSALTQIQRCFYFRLFRKIVAAQEEHANILEYQAFRLLSDIR